MAAAIRPAVPAGPRQPVWVRRHPGATGWDSQSRRTGTPRTPASAHSTWGRKAGGHECTNSTPRAVTLTSVVSRIGFPTGLDARAVTRAAPGIVPHQPHLYQCFGRLIPGPERAECRI